MSLYNKNTSDGYFWNSLLHNCKLYIKNCKLCQTKNKTTFPPPHPKELYVIDLAELPNILKKKLNKKLYLLSIVEHFSKNIIL